MVDLQEWKAFYDKYNIEYSLKIGINKNETALEIDNGCGYIGFIMLAYFDIDSGRFLRYGVYE